MLRYAITDRRMFTGGEAEQENALLRQARRLGQQGVDFLQLRERDLAPEALLRLGSRVRAELPRFGGTRLLLNSDNWCGGRVQADVRQRHGAAWQDAILRGMRSAGAHGLHLPGGWNAGELRSLRAAWDELRAEPESEAGSAAESTRGQRLTTAEPLLLSVACHRVSEVGEAAAAGADLLLFSPVFEKRTESGAVPGTGLERLREAAMAAGTRPVFALGGVTRENTPLCAKAGAAGIAGIRLFATE